MVCSLAAETMEDDYLAMVERHKAGKVGKRGIDLMPVMFAELVNAMTNHNRDVLGDLFQTAVSHQERGQFFTPESITTLLAELTVESPADSHDQSVFTISDPLCGPRHKGSCVAHTVMWRPAVTPLDSAVLSLACAT